jgi:SAM-dependent methyltransferase
VPKLEGFANIWEHARLLSDTPRTQAFIELMERHARGKRVLEIGCGTGLLSCIAARMGADRVYAVEPTQVADVVKALVARNGLADTVEVIEGRLEDLEARPVDLAFSELLNADPFAEGVVGVTNQAASWVVKGGLLAPNRLRVYAALAYGTDCAREARAASHSIQAFGERFALDLAPLTEALKPQASYRFMSGTQTPISDPVLLYDLSLGDGTQPAAEVQVQAVAREAGVVDGVIVWFECVVDDGIILHNRPQTENHWGQLICAWATERGVRAGQAVNLKGTLVHNELDVTWETPSD